MLVGQDAGTVVGHHCMLMRPDLFSGFFMTCSPQARRAPVKPSSAVAAVLDAHPELVLYSEYLQQPGTAEELDLHDFLSGIFYSTSAPARTASGGAGRGRMTRPSPTPTPFRRLCLPI